MKEYEYTGKAMGTDFSISIICDSKEIADEIAQIVTKDIYDYENRFSRFKTDSELSKLNESKRMIVSSEFIKIMEETYKFYLETNGIFNPLVQISRLGYTANFKDILPNSKIEEEEYNIDFSKTIIDKANSKIILQKGQKVDLGGILKGYVAEKLCKKIMSYSKSITGAIVNIGGDLHTQGLDSNNEIFVFDIYNPITNLENIKIPVHNQSLATSGTYKRKWELSGEPIHHILDSSGTQNPQTDFVSVSIVHAHGTVSEVYTKVFLSLEHEKASKLLIDKEIKFVAIKNDGSIISNII